MISLQLTKLFAKATKILPSSLDYVQSLFTATHHLWEPDSSSELPSPRRFLHQSKKSDKLLLSSSSTSGSVGGSSKSSALTAGRLSSRLLGLSSLGDLLVRVGGASSLLAGVGVGTGSNGVDVLARAEGSDGGVLLWKEKTVSSAQMSDRAACLQGGKGHGRQR